METMLVRAGYYRFQGEDARTDGFTPLMKAAERDHPEAAEALIAAGADVSACANEMTTALKEASLRGHYYVVIPLLEAGAEVNTQPPIDDGRTAPPSWTHVERGISTLRSCC